MIALSDGLLVSIQPRNLSAVIFLTPGHASVPAEFRLAEEWERPLRAGNPSAEFFGLAASSLAFHQLSLGASRAFRLLPAPLGNCRLPILLLGGLPLLKLVQQSLQGEFSIGELGARVARDHAQTTWLVQQRHRSGDLVDVLAQFPRVGGLVFDFMDFDSFQSGAIREPSGGGAGRRSRSVRRWPGRRSKAPAPRYSWDHDT